MTTASAGSEPAASPVQPIKPLTWREDQARDKLANTLSDVEITGELFITVKTDVASPVPKVGARHSVEIAIWPREAPRVGSGRDSAVYPSQHEPLPERPSHGRCVERSREEREREGSEREQRDGEG